MGIDLPPPACLTQLRPGTATNRFPRLHRTVEQIDCEVSMLQASHTRQADRPHGNGRIFWFMRKKFWGSYFALSCWSRR